MTLIFHHSLYFGHIKFSLITVPPPHVPFLTVRFTSKYLRKTIRNDLNRQTVGNGKWKQKQTVGNGKLYQRMSMVTVKNEGSTVNLF